MRKLYFGLGTLCLLFSLILLYIGIPGQAPEKPIQVKEAASAAVEYAAAEHAVEPEKEVPLRNPIDFAALQEVNEDIYAWLYIPGTEINHPILQSQNGDNDYYLTHTVDHLEDDNGCLFTEYYFSDKDFEIPVTVVYGHRRRSGDMFGQLEELYALPGSLKQLSEIIIYTPEKELHYQAIAESEFSNMHIPDHYDRFRNPEDMFSFMDEIKLYHTMTKQIDETVSLSTEDKLLVLSTCLVRNDDQRFLVIAKLVKETRWTS